MLIKNLRYACWGAFLICFSSISFAVDINLVLTPSEKAWLAKHKVISVGPDFKYAPVEMLENGVHTGVSGDYFKLISERLGVKFVVKSDPSWDQSMKLAVDKKIDLMTAIQITPKRRDLFLFTDPYIYQDTAIITQSASSNEIEIDDLKGRKVAFVKGYFWEEVLTRDYPEIELVEVSSLSHGLGAVAFGQVDAFFASYATASYYIQKNNISNLKVSGLTPYQIRYAIAVRNDWPELQSIINKALASISPEQRAEIQEKWIKLDFHIPWYSKAIVKYLTIIFAALSLLVLLVLLWIYSLRRQVFLKTAELKIANKLLESRVLERTKELQQSNEELEKSRESLVDANFKLEKLAHLDAVTQVANRRALDFELLQILESKQYKNLPLSILMIDIDYFKANNDQNGHLEGDRCLLQVAQSLRALARRDGEFFGRFGGEEFSYLLPRVDREKAIELAEIVLDTVRKLKIINKGSQISEHLTVSIGILTVKNDNSYKSEQLLNMGDEALYKAKRQGRDRYEIYQP